LPERYLVRVWNVTRTSDGKQIRVATIEQGPRKPSMCEGCSSPCCQGIFRPILTSEEFLAKKFKTTFIPAPKWVKKRVPRAEYIATLAFDKQSYCSYFDPDKSKCTIFHDPPKACLAYDCRTDPRMKRFVERRLQEWRQQ